MVTFTIDLIEFTFLAAIRTFDEPNTFTSTVSIGNSRSRLAILRAEWAYQNRPHRLRDLADMNYEHLQLLPLRADHFSRIEHVRFPVTPKLNLNELYVVEIANRGINND